MPSDLAEALADLNADEADDIIRMLSEAQLAQANRFAHWRHAGQAPPPGDWRTWLICGGRGFGKTRAGAEWVLARAREGNAETHIALVGGDLEDARRVMIEGPSGILACAEIGEAIDYAPSRRELVFPSGARATLYSGATAAGLRGPEHDFAWCDEIAKWTQAKDAWDNLQLGLRRGANPCAVVTTTPKAGSLVKVLDAEADSVTTGGGSRANIYLPPAYFRAIERRYAGTRQGAEELEGKILSDVEGSLWPSKLIEACRLPGGPERLAADAARVVIGVDPPASVGGTCGIVACAVQADGTFTILADESVARASPEGWANAVALAADRWGADRVVAEKNQGGDMVQSVLKAARRTLPLKLVHAARGKSARAEPIAALFENGASRFAGSFPQLEAELTGLQTGGGYAGPGASPDRADAMVWALTELALQPEPVVPRVRVI